MWLRESQPPDKSIAMKLKQLIVLIFIAISFKIFSQDSLKTFRLFSRDSLQEEKKEKVFFHSIGGGVEWVGSRHSNFSGDVREINYNNPFFGGFYRFIISPKRMNGKMCFTLNGIYRTGSGRYNQSDGKLYYSSYKGPFFSTRFDLGFTYLLSFGKKENFSIGWGACAGARILRTNELIVNQDTSYYENKTSTSLQLGVNVELQYRIKIKENSGVILGAKGIICTPDGFGFLFAGAVFSFLSVIF